MSVAHFVTEELMYMSETKAINEFKSRIEALNKQHGHVISFTVFTRPYLDQNRDDLYECQFNFAKTLVRESSRLFGNARCTYLIYNPPDGLFTDCPYIAAVCDGKKFSLAAPRDLSFVTLSLRNGNGVSFKNLDEAYAKHQTKFDEDERRKNFFKDMKIFNESTVFFKKNPSKENVQNSVGF
ncbi:hypothetical protein FACS189472_00010 [Alphaproteobacteria bacterium]|nr:hypothetical protein FACS189472_00010 [Alphaproteobacteria bacterium]